MPAIRLYFVSSLSVRSHTINLLAAVVRASSRQIHLLASKRPQQVCFSPLKINYVDGSIGGTIDQLARDLRGNTGHHSCRCVSQGGFRRLSVGKDEEIPTTAEKLFSVFGTRLGVDT